MPARTPQPDLADIISEPLRFPTRSGLKLAAMWDHRADGYKRCPYAIVAPKYGETKKNNLQLAYLLAANGMNVVRFDHANHVGESAGSRSGFTLPSGVDDILATVDYLEEHFGATGVTLLASSLSSRTALRAAALDPRIRLLVNLVGLVNVGRSLHAAYREDLIANYLAGKRWGISDILGHEVDFDAFLGTAIDADLHGLEGTLRDMEKVPARVVFFSGVDDVWVDIEEVRLAVAASPTARLVILDGVKHEILESRDGGDTLLDVVRLVVQESWGLEHPPAEVHVPNQRVLLTQNRVEREHLREAAPPTVAETDFWSDYLRKYELLDRVDDYRDYLDLVGDLLGPFAPAEMILDAGCGVGLLGAWLLRRIQRSDAKDIPRFYTALDLTDSGLADAMGRHAALISSALGKPGAGAGVDVQYARADFDHLAPDGGPPAIPMFHDETFDAICCSLVLSYLIEPMHLLRELRRVSRPGARIVVSSMKPHCDMSVIYRDFIDQQVNPSEVDSARNLLRAAGQIKLKEEQGFYRFLSGEDMAGMLKSAGFSQTRIFSSFGEQAFVVRASA